MYLATQHAKTPILLLPQNAITKNQRISRNSNRYFSIFNKTNKMKLKTLFLILFFGLSTSFLHAQTTGASSVKKGMIKVTILYPNGDGKTFDMDYYSKKHMPMVAKLLGGALKSLGIDK